MRVETSPEPDQWDAFVAGHPAGWWWHTTGWRDYQRHCGAADNSFALIDDCGEVCGVAPVLSRDGVAAPDGRPGYLLSPGLADPGYAARLVMAQAATIGLRLWTMASRPDVPTALADLGHAARVVMLQRPESALWRDVRRSYHALIHRAEERFRIQRMSLADLSGQSPLCECMALHAVCAGRQTRPWETWDLMGRWASDGHADVWLAFDDTISTVSPAAFVYVYRWKGWAYYGHAASIAPDATHALLWAAIRYLSRTGVEFLDMGSLPAGEPDEKALNVHKFKCGFGGQDWPVRVQHVGF